MLITAILAWFHVISAIGWLGGGIMFVFVVGPALAKLSPPSSAEFLVNVAPRVARFFQISAASTILFGALLLVDGNGNKVNNWKPNFVNTNPSCGFKTPATGSNYVTVYYTNS